MNVPVVMPQLGLTMTEGSVSEWLKKPGEFVRKGEMLFVVSTDKADMEVESLDEGKVVQIVVEPGSVVPVGTVIAYLGSAGDAISTQPVPSKTAGAPAPQPMEKKTTVTSVRESSSAVAMAAARKDGFPASPRARKVARELGVDISQVTPGGSERIVEEDVRRFAAAAQPVVESVQPKPADAPPKVSQAKPADLRRRQVIAERLTKSIQTIPHFSLSVEVRADQLVALRESLKGPVQEKTGQKITVTDLLLKTLGLALMETAGMRAAWADGNSQMTEAVDLGMAIAAENGVVAPVVRNVGRLDLAEIARWRQTAAEKTRGGRLALSDLEGGIGTLSNLGMYRVDQFHAIISPGQSFILAVGKIDQRPWVEDGELCVAPTVSLTLSVDHRVADGALAARFLEKIAEIIENPYRLLWTPGKPQPSK
jgi:pyruvate dehydrogenase E2 component (dihydrolipoamide acetyltransferase)